MSGSSEEEEEKQQDIQRSPSLAEIKRRSSY
jgi:hypothetical protein